MGGSTSRFDETSVPDLRKKVIVITGANSGIGFEAAKIFAKKGASIVMLGRSKERLEEAEKEVNAAAALGKKEAPADDKGDSKQKIEIGLCDLSSQKNTREAAARILAAHPDGIDVLVNNAGVMAVAKHTKTEDGLELQMATNHYGHFTLTSLLLPLLVKRPGSRVVNVSSGYHTIGNTTEKGIVLEDMQADKGYDKWMQYRCSKFANVLFTKELQRRLEAAGVKGVTSVVCHPGYSATRLQREVTGASIANAVAAQSQYMGSLPICMAAAGDVPPASYVGPPGMAGYPIVQDADKRTDDEEVAKGLWEHSEEVTKATWPALGEASAPAASYDKAPASDSGSGSGSGEAAGGAAAGGGGGAEDASHGAAPEAKAEA